MSQLAQNKHLAKLKTSDRRVLIAYWAIPDHEDSAVVIDIDSLPDQLKEPLILLARSPEAQNVLHLGELMNRRRFPNSQASMLAVYFPAYTQLVPHKKVVCTPERSRHFEMTKVIEEFKKAGIQLFPDQTEKAEEIIADITDESPDFLDMPLAQTTQQVGDPSNFEFQARNKLMQADLLEQDVKKLRIEANHLLEQAGFGRKMAAAPKEMKMGDAVKRTRNNRSDRAKTIATMIAGADVKKKRGRPAKNPTPTVEGAL